MHYWGFVIFATLWTVLSGHGVIEPGVIRLLLIAYPVYTEVAANIKSCDEIRALLSSCFYCASFTAIRAIALCGA